MTPEDEPTASRAVADRRIAEFDSDDLGDDERAQPHAAILAPEREQAVASS
jgi:hypothetical protein